MEEQDGDWMEKSAQLRALKCFIYMIHELEINFRRPDDS